MEMTVALNVFKHIASIHETNAQNNAKLLKTYDTNFTFLPREKTRLRQCKISKNLFKKSSASVGLMGRKKER
jgi:hypothetical protein